MYVDAPKVIEISSSIETVYRGKLFRISFDPHEVVLYNCTKNTVTKVCRLY